MQWKVIRIRNKGRKERWYDDEYRRKVLKEFLIREKKGEESKEECSEIRKEI